MLNRKNLFVVIFAFSFGLLIGIISNFSLGDSYVEKEINKIGKTLKLVNKYYVDSVKINQISDKMIEQGLERLDPHSVFIPAAELGRINEEFQGNFEGIGVEYIVKNDTIRIVNPIPDGPSIRLGILAGDRIIAVNDSSVIGIKNEDVPKVLRGEKGSKVKLTILRPGNQNRLDFVVIRDKVNLYSMDAAFMLTDSVGYIKLNRFSATTYKEFYDGITKLKKLGMTNLILDLRGNPGGYLDQAVKISDELLGGSKKIVYTKGRDREVEETFSTDFTGEFEDGKLIILIDSGSASASEIVAGAVQDWDRGLIAGTHSFGKGLVQKQFSLDDSGGAIRLTIARYYTPSGRSIQRDYSEGKEKYYQLASEGENDSLHTSKNQPKFKTANGRTVYGAGGITADYFIREDSLPEAIVTIFRKNLFYDFASNFTERNQPRLKNSFVDAAKFIASFRLTENDLMSFYNLIERNGINLTSEVRRNSEILIESYIYASIARQLWGNEGFYRVRSESDNHIQSSLKLLNDPQKYSSLLGLK